MRGGGGESVECCGRVSWSGQCGGGQLVCGVLWQGCFSSCSVWWARLPASAGRWGLGIDSQFLFICFPFLATLQFAPIRRCYSTVLSGVVHACYVLCSVCPPLDDVTAPCCRGLCMHVKCLAQFQAFHGSGWKSFMFVTPHDYVFLPICLTCSFALVILGVFFSLSFAFSPLQLF